jgi:hypothetical protein
MNCSPIHKCGNWETEQYNCFGNNKATQFHFWEYINRNQTFILDTHKPFIFSLGGSPNIRFSVSVSADEGGGGGGMVCFNNFNNLMGQPEKSC